MELWTSYRLSLEFLTDLCGSVPGDPDLVKKWLEARKPNIKPPGGMSMTELSEEVLASLPEAELEPSKLIFQRNPADGIKNLVVRAGTIRAHYKDCARKISSHLGKIKGEKTFATKVLNYLYYEPHIKWVAVLRPDGSLVMEADGERDKPVHVTDAYGRPQNALKTFEFVNPARIDFTIQIFSAGGKEAINREDLETLFTYGGTHGYGGERSDGEGRYTFTLERIEKEKEYDGKEKGKDAASNRRGPDNGLRDGV